MNAGSWLQDQHAAVECCCRKAFKKKVKRAERTASRKKEKCSDVLVVDEKAMSSKVNSNDMGIE